MSDAATAPAATSVATSASPLAKEVRRRRTFAIVSPPGCGQDHAHGKAAPLRRARSRWRARSRRGRASRHATSDWMEIEKQRGISVALSSVMQFEYAGHCVINLLDTPGHEDFSRGHLPRAHGGGRRGHGDRRGQGRGGADASSLLEVCRAAQHADHHLREQDGPRGTGAVRTLLEEIESGAGQDRLRADQLAAGHGQGLFGGVFHLLQGPACCVFTPGEDRSAAATSETIEGIGQPAAWPSCFPDAGRAGLRADDGTAALGPACAFDLQAEFLAGTADPGVLRLGRSTTSACRRSWTGAGRPGPRRRSRATRASSAKWWRRAEGAVFSGVRVQDPGQHGPAATATASRSSCVWLSGQVTSRGMKAAAPARQARRCKIANARGHLHEPTSACTAVGRGLGRRHHRHPRTTASCRSAIR